MEGEMRKEQVERGGREFEPPYPADLLDRMAKVLGAIGFQISRQEPVLPGDIMEVLDEYAAEVGRNNVPNEVWGAMGRLTEL